jgi:two-component system response regulator MtrA
MKGRVLVVDDDAALSEMIGIMLRGEGFDPMFVADGDHAVQAFRDTRPDLVLLDLMLPGLDGIDVCRQIRTESGVPIVMLTAKSDTVDVVLGLESGADDYIVKPFKSKELIARVGRGAPDQDPVPEILQISDVTTTAGHSVATSGRSALPPLEFDLLVALARKPPRLSPGAGLGLPARGGYPAGQRTRAAAARQDRERSGAPGDRGDGPRRGLQGRSGLTGGGQAGTSTPVAAGRTRLAAWADPALRTAHRFPRGLRTVLRAAWRQAGSLAGLMARRWHRSLQLRVIGTTLVVSVAVVAVLGIFLMQQIASGLLNNERKAAITQANEGLTFAQSDADVLGPNGNHASALISLVTQLQSGSGLGNTYDVVVWQRNTGLMASPATWRTRRWCRASPKRSARRWKRSRSAAGCRTSPTRCRPRCWARMASRWGPRWQWASPSPPTTSSTTCSRSRSRCRC